MVEFKSRQANIETVHKAAKELLATGDDDSRTEVTRQLEELDKNWEHTKELASLREKGLDAAKNLAEHFHRISYAMLEWLSDVEANLKDMGSIPENEEELLKKIDQIEGIHDDLVAHSSEMEEIRAVSKQILDRCHPKGELPMKHFTDMVQARYDEVSSWAEQRENRLKTQLQTLRELEVLLNDLLQWMGDKEHVLSERLAEEIPMNVATIEQLIEQHHSFEADLRLRQLDVDEATKGLRKSDSSEAKDDALPKGTKKLSTPQKLRMDRRKNPKVKCVSDKWRKLWLLSLERQQKLNDMLNYAQELKKLESFNFDDWRQRYLKWINHKKSRVMDFFRRQDKDCDGKVTREEFVEGILSSSK
ncbi:unnamed protein product [Soboliphyme baturini]|uniref:EF-hand domain-containing protein n=1 Tax=Soboliphyme baturini TaxID=241478 RepID=A0A183J5T6_9BILA|nr:unnamed protein product [Soboliphyme baturini]